MSADPRWQALYAACRPALYRSAALLVGEAEAEEVVQDAFERAMRERDFFTKVRDPVAWLRTVSTRAALGRLRRRALFDRALSIVGRQDHQVDPLRTDLEAALARLPAKQRAAVVLRYYHDAPYAEIASALEIDVESVGPLLTRARAALRESLK
ncbi:MAG: RNA polymerase sigma factor [Chloroflexota bacterium]|nr:RNA polymerase sigma factor [Chloroflexota bacterium]MDE3194377.1 RNA polymerase sigma factor [Chloroflexota bacterium]